MTNLKSLLKLWSYLRVNMTNLQSLLTLWYYLRDNMGMGMINIQEFIDSKRIKLQYRILHEPLESWNAIGKYWLRKLDIKFNEKYFVCKCSNVSTLNLNSLMVCF
jgi:hypothetical protein